MAQQVTSTPPLSKHKLIRKLTKDFAMQQPSAIAGLQEDATAIGVGSEYSLTATTTLLEGAHFDLAYFPLKHLAYKAVTTSLAKVLAMNGKPGQIALNLAADSRFTEKAWEELFKGFHIACESYEVDLVGVDIVPAASGLVLTVTALGRVANTQLCQRKGAQPHDILCVTGDLGAAYLGLQILNREKQVFQADPAMQPELTPYAYLIQRQLKPEARIDMQQVLHDLKLLPTAMINVSDGLAAALFQLSEASQVGVHIYEDKLPIDNRTYETAVALHLDPITCALNGGEDYELLFAIRQKDLSKVEHHPDISLIGYATNEPSARHLITKAGSHVPLQTQGW